MRLAIIGTGIAGLGCAHFLGRRHPVTLYDQNDYPGGHTNTIQVSEGGREVSFDTGFMVFNHVTYPNLVRLFRELDVATERTDMSFSVQHVPTGLEFCGSGWNELFAQRRNLLRPRFWGLLRQVDRFNREAVAALGQAEWASTTIGDYVRNRCYGTDFLDQYLIPMSSAVWSTPPDLMLNFPAQTLLRFFHNHGFLGLHTQHPWWTVDGGSRNYVDRLIAPFRDRIRTGDGVAQVARGPRGVTLTLRSGREQVFDRVILACHGDQALRLLADPTPDERRLLGEFRCQPNTATVHTDESVMPRARLAWSSWNYELNRDAAGRPSTATHYWMNSLQGVSDRVNYFVSINRPEAVAPGKVLRRIAYEHPLFSLGAVRAQAEIPALNAAARGAGETYFAGAWQRYGFHEDGLLSAVRLCELLLGRDPWTA